MVNYKDEEILVFFFFFFLSYSVCDLPIFLTSFIWLW